MSSARLDAIRSAFDRRAADYDDSAMHRSLAEAVAEFARLDDVDHALDVATGTGLVLRALHVCKPNLTLTGVDLSPGMLAVARRMLPTADWVEADAVRLPLTAASIDLITCVTALHIIPNVDAAIAEWHRVLQPDGRVVTATFSRIAIHPGTAAVSPDHPYPRRHEPFHSMDTLKNTMLQFGFTLDRHQIWSDDTDEILIAELSFADEG